MDKPKSLLLQNQERFLQQNQRVTVPNVTLNQEELAEVVADRLATVSKNAHTHTIPRGCAFLDLRN